MKTDTIFLYIFLLFRVPLFLPQYRCPSGPLSPIFFWYMTFLAAHISLLYVHTQNETSISHGLISCHIIPLWHPQPVLPNYVLFHWGQWPTGRGGVWGVQTPPPPRKFRRPSKIVPNSTRWWKLLKSLNLGCQHPKMFGKKAVKF